VNGQRTTFAAATRSWYRQFEKGKGSTPKSATELKQEALRAALIEGEQSGASTPFDFDDFVNRKRQGK
jgi:hypothetical protein